MGYLDLRLLQYAFEQPYWCETRTIQKKRCDPGVRNHFSVQDEFIVRKTIGEDSLLVETAGENLFCNLTSLVSHVELFVLLAMKPHLGTG